MAMLWMILAALVLIAGYRYRQRLGSRRSTRSPAIDDADIQRIIQQGSLPDRQKQSDRQQQRSDRAAAAEAEEEFWSEYWDEPDEYEP